MTDTERTASDSNVEEAAVLKLCELTLDDNEDRFIGSDNQPMTVSQVIDGFTGEKCRCLIGKPKIFFFQFCRQGL